MTLPIPRIVWPVEIVAGVNDLLLFHAGGYDNAGWFAYVEPGTYLTPEALVAALRRAFESAITQQEVPFGSEGYGVPVSVAVSPSGVLSIALGDDVIFLDPDAGAALHWSPPPWEPSTEYTDAFVSNAGNVYWSVSGGVSASGGGGPTGTNAPFDTPIGDGTVGWYCLGKLSAAHALARLLGFSPETVTAPVIDGAATFTAQHQLPNLWTPDAPVRSDTGDREMESIVAQVETVGGQSKTTRWTPAHLSGRRRFRRLRFEWLQPHKVFAEAATGDKLNQAFESFWCSHGVGRFRYSPDRDNPEANAADLVLRGSSLTSFKPERASDAVERYHFDVECMRWHDSSGNESP